MRAAVILFPGVNREGDAARALRQSSGAEPRIVWHADQDLPRGTELVVLPGGFSYGDYLRCGAIAARAPIMRAVRDHAARGGLVLGICNGFQILCEAGLLPGVLMRNAHRRFICKMQHLRVENDRTPFTRGYQRGQVSHSPSPTARAILSPTRRPFGRSRRTAASRSAIATSKGESGTSSNPTDRSIPSPACSTSGLMCSG